MRGLMKYTFTINTSVSDLWQLSMYGIYGSIIGITNVVFTVTMILLTVRYFAGAHIILKCLMIIGISLFTVIQPLAVYLRARKQVKGMPQGVNLGFDDQGIHIVLGDQKSDIEWAAVRGITRKPTLLVIFSSEQYGFVLNNKLLGEQRKEFYDYISSKVEKGGQSTKA